MGGFTVNSGTNSAAWNTIRFRPDVNQQWTATELGINLTKGPLNLVSKEFRMPKLLRTSLAVDKVIGDGWRVSVEGLFSKNINEIYYTNINILPPTVLHWAPEAEWFIRQRLIFLSVQTVRILMMPLFCSAITGAKKDSLTIL